MAKGKGKAVSVTAALLGGDAVQQDPDSSGIPDSESGGSEKGEVVRLVAGHPEDECACGRMTASESEPETSASEDVSASEDASDKCEKCREKEKQAESSEADESAVSEQSSEKDSIPEEKQAESSEADSGVSEQSSEKDSIPAENSEAQSSAEEPSASEAATTSEEAQSSKAETSSAADSGAKSETTENSKAGNEASTVDDDDGWTMSETALLKGMKEGGSTWAGITKALNKSKSQCQQKWKAVQAEEKSGGDGGDTADKENEAEKSGGDGGDPTDKKDEAAKSGGDGGDSTDKKKQAEVKSDRKTKKKQAEVKSVAKNGKTSESKKAKPPASKIKPPEPAPRSSSSSSESPSTTSSVERAEQARYLQTEIYPQLYPPIITPKPDDFFSSSDCDALAHAHSKAMRSRMLEMQANFYNATGRMVPLSFLASKCEGSEGNILQGKKLLVERWATEVASAAACAEEEEDDDD